MGHVLPAEQDPARSGSDESNERLRDRSLPASALAHEAEDLALGDGETDPVYRVDLHIASAQDPLNEAAEYGEVYVEVLHIEEGIAHDDRPSTDGTRPSGGPLPRDETRERRSRRRRCASNIVGTRGTPPN